MMNVWNDNDQKVEWVSELEHALSRSFIITMDCIFLKNSVFPLSTIANIVDI